MANLEVLKFVLIYFWIILYEKTERDGTLYTVFWRRIKDSVGDMMDMVSCCGLLGPQTLFFLLM